MPKDKYDIPDILWINVLKILSMKDRGILKIPEDPVMSCHMRISTEEGTKKAQMKDTMRVARMLIMTIRGPILTSTDPEKRQKISEHPHEAAISDMNFEMRISNLRLQDFFQGDLLTRNITPVTMP